jgi:hypothetical protein
LGCGPSGLNRKQTIHIGEETNGIQIYGRRMGPTRKEFR